MWRCQACGETVADDAYDTCWSCGAPRDGGDAAWTRPTADGESAWLYERDRQTKIRVLAAVGRAFGLVAAYPVILLAALPSLAWELVLPTAGLPSEALAPPHAGFQWAEHASGWLSDLLVEPLAEGLAIVLVHAALQGAVTVPRVLAQLRRGLPRIVGLLALLAAGALLFSFVAPLPKNAATRIAGTIAWVVLIWVTVRLTFWPVSVLVDDASIAASLERSWLITRGNWWRTVALNLIFFPAAALGWFLPRPIAESIAQLVAPILQAVLVCAYLQRTGRLRDGQATAALAPIPAPGG